MSSKKPLFRPTWATIDLAALAHNYEVIRRHLPKRIGIMAMIKADAYGHGAVQVASALEKCDVRAFGVATVEEGAELRESGITKQIVVMGGLMGAGEPASKIMINLALTPVVHSRGILESLESDAARAGKKIGVHLKIDTGMSRLGVRPESLKSILDGIKASPHLYVDGVMTHLAEGDQDEPSQEQLRRFIECRVQVEAELGPIKIWHIANSAACLRGEPIDIPGAAEAWARPGLALYGDCNGFKFDKCNLKPVMGLVSQAVLIKRVPAGTRVSYGGTFTTERASRLGIVPIGYADGYPWSVSGKAKVLIRGKRVPVIGRVTMDMIIIDITDVDDVAINDEVVLLGRQGDAEVSLHELADWAGTIPYEILCGISKRMPRIYQD